jgi:antirestriction protein ArdC
MFGCIVLADLSAVSTVDFLHVVVSVRKDAQNFESWFDLVNQSVTSIFINTAIPERF